MKHLTALMLCAGLLSPAFLLTAHAAPQSAPAAATKVTTIDGISEYRFANGLRVLLLPDASKPTITTNIVYLVGSRHENYGETGMAHLLEHMTFIRTTNFGVKQGSKTPSEVLNTLGGSFNGTTMHDRTNYFASFPASDENLKKVLELEADRMVNATINQDDLWNKATSKGEMTVVRNEFEQKESNPMFVTLMRVYASAFDWHNYGKATIGTLSDIEQVDISHLRAFYSKYYQPDNAVLMLGGRFDEAKVLAQIGATFGRIPKPNRVIAPLYTREPVQDGERQVMIRRSGGMQLLVAGYHQSPAGHPDDLAMGILGQVLCAPPSGRLYKALVDTKLAAQVAYFALNHADAGFGNFLVMMQKDADGEAAQRALIKVLENIKAEPITEDEVARARQAMKAQLDLAASNSSATTLALTEAVAAGDWRLFAWQRATLDKLDAAAVQAVAVRYLKSSNRTLGHFIPTDAPDRAAYAAPFDLAATLKDFKGGAALAKGEAFDTAPANIDARTVRLALPNGMKAALLGKTTNGNVVNVAFKLRMGSEASLRGKAQASAFAADLLMFGSARLSRQEIKDGFDKLKSAVSIKADPQNVTVNLTTTRDNLPAAMDLLAEVLQHPSYPESGFQEVQRSKVAGLQAQLTEPGPIAANALMRMVDPTPESHVGHVQTLDSQLAQLKVLKLDDVKSFHHDFYNSTNATFTAVGDFDAAALKAQLTKLYGGWNASQAYARAATGAVTAAAKRQLIETPDKANSVLFAAIPMAMRDDDPEFAALTMANFMLGGGTLRSRLADRIRKQEGLSYLVQSMFEAEREEASALWSAFAISAPQNTAKVEAALRDELEKVAKDGYSESELAEAKKGWLQAAVNSRSNDAPLAGHINDYLAIGRPIAYDGALEAKVAALGVAQVNAAVRKYLEPSKLMVVGAGDFAKLAKPAGAH